MNLQPGDVVLIEARVVEDFGDDARVQFGGNRSSVQVCIDKSEFRSHDPRSGDFLIKDIEGAGGRPRKIIVPLSDRMSAHR